ncbi:MAG: hypothetical protein WBL35_07685 [Ornithinibacter sp.]
MASDGNIDEKRDAVLQDIIDAMVRESSSWAADDAAHVLEDRIAGRGLPVMPEPWIRAVASGVARGEAYVVSARTHEDMDIPAPRTRRLPYGID